MGPRGRRNIEKPKNFKQAIKNLFFVLKPFRGWIVISIILAFVASIISILGPDKIKEITNLIVLGLSGEININKIKEIALYLICLYLIGALSNYFVNFIMATITNRFSKTLRSQISEKINKLPLKYFDNNSYGEILSCVTNDVDTMSGMIQQSIGTFVSSITLFIGSIFMMFKTNYILAFVSIGASLIGFLFMMVVLIKSQKYFQKFQDELGSLNGHIEETYTAHNIIKVYNGYEEEVETFDSINNEMFESALKSHFFSGLMHPFMGFIGNLSYVLVCVVGSYLAINGTIDFGVIVAFTIYARLFSQPLSQIAQVASSFQSAGAASERVFEFLEVEEMQDEHGIKTHLDKNDVKGEIVFQHVKFGYDEKTIIKDFSSRAHPGDKIAIVGPTGAGKTTLVNLLMKFYNITDGDILIDGENISYNKEVKFSKIKEICQKIGLDHTIETLSQGYDTILNDTETLSAGEKQLLTIARGMIKDSPFLILDEATSSVDTRTEELVSLAMDSLCEGRTSFIIAHRLSTIKNADLILVLNDGNIVEQGTHEELLEKNGFYANLYNSQFQKIN